MTKTSRLLNLGPVTEGWLRAVGIYGREDLERVGSVEAFTRVVERGFDAHAVFLYALEGALTDTRWHELSEETKARLRDEASRIRRRARAASAR